MTTNYFFYFGACKNKQKRPLKQTPKLAAHKISMKLFTGFSLYSYSIESEPSKNSGCGKELNYTKKYGELLTLQTNGLTSK